MPFPSSDRIIFNKNPLEQVICQLRFPPILQIDKEPPAQFQELIRQQFPEFSESREGILIPAEILSSLKLPVSQNKNYEFSSSNNQLKVNLTNCYLAFSTTDYTRWENFVSHLTHLIEILNKVYAPSYFTRIGLRYIDVIQRSKFGLSDFNWNELLQPFILGMASTPEVCNSIDGYENTSMIKLNEDDDMAKFVVKIGTKTDCDEKILLIDTDFFTKGQISISDCAKKLNFFNRLSSNLIQWCITDKLRNAMEPIKL